MITREDWAHTHHQFVGSFSEWKIAEPPSISRFAIAKLAEMAEPPNYEHALALSPT